MTLCLHAVSRPISYKQSSRFLLSVKHYKHKQWWLQSDVPLPRFLTLLTSPFNIQPRTSRRFLTSFDPTLWWCHCSHGNIVWDPAWEGLVLVSRRGCLQRVDIDHVMDPEIGHQILQALPRGSFLTALTLMGAEPFKDINTLISVCWLGSLCHFRLWCWWCWWLCYAEMKISYLYGCTALHTAHCMC